MDCGKFRLSVRGLYILVDPQVIFVSLGLGRYTVHRLGQARASPLLLALDPGPAGSAWPRTKRVRPGLGQGQPWPQALKPFKKSNYIKN